MSGWLRKQISALRRGSLSAFSSSLGIFTNIKPRCPECSQSFSWSVLGPGDENSQSFFDRESIRTWSSFAVLDQLATEGCDCCILFRQYLTNFVPYLTLKDATGAIEVDNMEHDLWLTCPSFQGSLIVPKMAKDDHRQRRTPPYKAAPRLDTLEQARTWLQKCLSRHSICQDCPSEGAFEQENGLWNHYGPLARLPKRLIDLAHGPVAILIDCTEWVTSGLGTVEMLQDYCALSYRWGDTGHDCILAEPFDVMKEVRIDSMPQTFQDAIQVTRELGVRYLWVDALCIVQPSAQDQTEWLEEGSRMGIIYENAICSIAATLAMHAHEGFLAQIGAHTFSAKPCLISSDSSTSESIVLPISIPSFAHCVTESPLNKRGWVVQERALSKRILHFTTHGIFWECGTTKASAQEPAGLDAPQDFPSCRSKETLLSVCRIRRTSHVCPVEWFHFIERYSYTEFTNPADRLLALSSVTRAVEPYMGQGRYAAGLWEKDLLRGLAWNCYHPKAGSRSLMKGVVPTWSWASVVGGVSFLTSGIKFYRFNIANVVDLRIIPQLPWNKYGAVSEGEVEMSGTLMSLDLPFSDRAGSHGDIHTLDVCWDEPQGLAADGSEQDDGGPPPGVSEASVTGSENSSIQDQISSKQTIRPFSCLPIAYEKSITTSKVHIGAIVLEPIEQTFINSRGVAEGGSNKYRRIGFVEFEWKQSLEYIRESWTSKSLARFDEQRWLNSDPTKIVIC